MWESLESTPSLSILPQGDSFQVLVMEQKGENIQWAQAWLGIERTWGTRIPMTSWHSGNLQIKRVGEHSSITMDRFLNFGQMMAFSWPGDHTWPWEAPLWNHTSLPSMAIDGKRLCQGGHAEIGGTDGREKSRQWHQKSLSRTFQPLVPISMSEYAVKRNRMMVLYSFWPKLSKVLEVPNCDRICTAQGHRLNRFQTLLWYIQQNKVWTSCPVPCNEPPMGFSRTSTESKEGKNLRHFPSHHSLFSRSNLMSN